MNVQGVIKYVYDNRLGKDGMANKFPNFKFKVGEQEIVLWSVPYFTLPYLREKLFL
jgi:hypothetical protein